MPKREARQADAAAMNEQQWAVWFYHRFVAELKRPDEEGGMFVGAIGQVIAGLRQEFEGKIAAQENPIKELETKLSLERRFDARGQGAAFPTLAILGTVPELSSTHGIAAVFLDATT